MRIMMIHAPSPIVRELCARDYEVLSSNSTRSFDTHDDLPVEWGPRQRSVNFPGRKKLSPIAIRTVAQLLREFRPDVLHAFTPSGLAWSVLAALRDPHPPALVSFRGIPRPLHRLDPSEWISYLSPRVTMHACESHAVEDQLVRSGIPRGRCRVVYNTTWNTEPSKTRSEWRREWGIPETAFVIGTVGHIRPVKGVDVLLRAAQRLLDVPGWQLLLGGPIRDPTVEAMARTPSLRSRVVCPGRIAPAPSAMQAMDLFVMASRSEGLCRALIEAMQVGLCPVVSDAGGMKELVRHGVDGMVFPSEDVEALASGLRQLIADESLRHRLASSAQQHARELCSPGVVTDKLLDLYAQALGRRGEARSRIVG